MRIIIIYIGIWIGLTNESCAQNLVLGDFENGSNAWGIWNGGTVTVVDNPSKTGLNTSNKVLHLTIPADKTWEAINQWQSPPKLNGEYVKVAVDVYVTNLTGNVRLVINVPIDPKWPDKVEILGNVPVANTWTHLEYDIATLPPDQYKQVAFFPLDGIKDIYFDNIEYITIPKIPVSSINIAPTGGVKAIAANGGTLQFNANVEPNNAFDTSIVWSVNDSYFASISASGKLTAKKNGTVTVTATSVFNKEIMASIDIPITNQTIVPPTKLDIISLSGKYKLKTTGVTLPLLADLSPANFDRVTVEWSVDDPAIATIDQKGTLSAKAYGTVIVTAVVKEYKTITRCLKIMVEAPTVKEKTLTDKHGEIIRATPLSIAKADFVKGTVAYVEKVENWKAIKDMGFNGIRLCWLDPWFKMRGGASWSVAEVMPLIEKCVKNATETGMNIILNYHVTGENMEFEDYSKVKYGIDYNRNHQIRADFWKTVAQKFKDNDLVYFELSNEPVFSHTHYNAPTFKSNLLAIYKIVRTEAPDRQVLLFSFNGTQYDLKSVINNYKDSIDWAKTSVAFHGYQDSLSTKVAEIMVNQRVICTEWDYPGTYPYVKAIDKEAVNSQTWERLKISWSDWRGWNEYSFDNFNNVLKPDALKKAYWWGSVTKPDTVACKVNTLINLPKSPDNITLYPSPTRGLITVNGLPENSIYRIKICTLQGSIVQNFVVASNQIDVSALKPGAYILLITGDNLYVKRFLKL